MDNFTNHDIRKMKKKLERELDDIADVDPDSDFPVSEKKAREKKIQK